MKKYIISGILAVTMLFSSCSLDTAPTNRVSDIEATSSIANLNLSMRGLYRFTLNEYWDNYTETYGITMFSIVDDVFGGSIVRDYVAYYSNEYGFVDAVTGSREGSAALTQWMLPYGAIRRTNAIIEVLKTLEVPSRDTDAKNQLIGEVYTMRAHMHHILNVKFSTHYKDDATARVTPSVIKRDNTSKLPAPRSTQYEIAQFALADLEIAIAAFKLVGGEIDPRYYSITAAKMVKARIQMYTKDYTAALATAEDIIANPQGKSIMGPANYKLGFNLATNPEWIFAGVFTPSYSHDRYSYFRNMGQNFSSIGNAPLFMDLSYLIGINGNADLLPGEKAYDGGLPNTIGLTMRREHDSRAELIIYDTEAEVKANLESNPDYYKDKGYQYYQSGMVNKYRQTVDGAGTGLGDIVMMRLAEAYYIAAESAAYLDNDGMARTYLTATASPYDSGAATFIATKSGDNLKTLISNYKAVDMWGEGRRLEDIKRRGEWTYRIQKYSKNASLTSTRQYKSIPPYLPQEAQGTVQFNDILTYAIPINELQNNDKVFQQGNS